jgi:hypothetical protein
MNWLIELLELLNECSPERASAYMFFIVILTYIVLNTVGNRLTDIIFVIKGYKKTKKGDTNKDV